MPYKRNSIVDILPLALAIGGIIAWMITVVWLPRNVEIAPRVYAAPPSYWMSGIRLLGITCPSVGLIIGIVASVYNTQHKALVVAGLIANMAILGILLVLFLLAVPP